MTIQEIIKQNLIQGQNIKFKSYVNIYEYLKNLEYTLYIHNDYTYGIINTPGITIVPNLNIIYVYGSWMTNKSKELIFKLIDENIINII